MRGVEGRPGQEAHQQFKAGLPGNCSGERSGSGEAGSAAHPFTAFVDRLAPTGERTQREERGLQSADPFTPFALMENFNWNYERGNWNAIGFEPTEEQNQFVKNVKLAYGIIAHPFSEIKTSSGEPSPIYQWEIEHQVAIVRAYEGRNRVVLTDEERGTLVKIAKTAGIPCDPERNEYFFNEIPEGQTSLEVYGRYHPPTSVDAEI